MEDTILGNTEKRSTKILNPVINNETGEFKFGRCPCCKSPVVYKGELESYCIVCQFPIKWEK